MTDDMIIDTGLPDDIDDVPSAADWAECDADMVYQGD
jgi:hypothetical protein